MRGSKLSAGDEERASQAEHGGSRRGKAGWCHHGAGMRALVLCHSQVPAKTDCVMFFGPVVPDGYGVCYNPMEAHINFSVSAYNSCAETNAVRLAHYLEKALLDMRALLQSHPQAKL